MEKADPKFIERILAIDWISIFLFYQNGRSLVKNFRLKWQKGRIRMATRYGSFLPDWQGCICAKEEPTLYLKKLDGKKVNLDVPIPPSDSLRDVFITKETPFGRMMILFTKSFVAQQGGIK